MNLAKKQEYFTYEDYITWDTDERYELIDGVPFMMSPAPTTTHQTILIELARKFADYLEDKSCRVFIAPVDVRLDPEGDDDTVVQPDLVVVCDESKISEHGIAGAPDLVVEILSPSTAVYDMSTKLDKYMDTGVLEYWIIDPKEKNARVYVQTGKANIEFSKYEIGDSIPSVVLKDLKINLGRVLK